MGIEHERYASQFELEYVPCALYYAASHLIIA